MINAIRYCNTCVYPDTKPDLFFNESGKCSACIAYDNRNKIDWSERSNQFSTLIARSKAKYPDTIYDCIVPVSGGKDSHFQIIKALEYNLKPLAVTATTDDLSVLGRRNLNNISKLGVDHIEITLNSQVRRKINNITLREVGDISWAEHISIFTIPVREAVIRKIPLILWGENPQNEYGGPNNESQNAINLNARWLTEFGGLNGMRITDILNTGKFSLGDLYQYTMPEMTLENTPNGIFLGQFLPWDGAANAELAAKHGFEFYAGPVEGCGVDYENLDNYQTGVHDYFKWLKFGFGRATDIACNRIRRGIITRQEGIEFVWEFDGKFPRTYLGQTLERTLRKIDMDIYEFLEICDKFTNRDIFIPREKFASRPKFKYNLLEVMDT